MIDYRSAWMKTVVLILAATVLLALPALAGFQEDVARDLGVKTATLVAPAGSEWLLDLDAASGVQAGDLFVIITKGAPVVHPVTKKVIGSIDETRAVLRVTKVKTGYSYAAVVSAKGELKAGDQARRFAGMPALFWDYNGDGAGVFAQLQGALPELHWQSYAAAQAAKPDPPRPVPGMEPGLVFVFNAQGLGVKDQDFQPLRFYRPDQFGRGTAAAGRRRRRGGGSGAFRWEHRRHRQPDAGGRDGSRQQFAGVAAENLRRRQQCSARPGRGAGWQRPECARRADRQPDGQQGRGLVWPAHGGAAGRGRRR